VRPLVLQTITIFVAIVICFVGFMFIMTRSIEQHRTEAVPPFSDIVASNLLERVDGLPEEELPAAVAEFGELMDTPTELVLLEGTEFPEYVRPRLENGQPGWHGDREGIRLYLPLSDGKHIVELGPVEGVFDPEPALLAKIVALMIAVAVIAATIPMIPLARRVRQLERAIQALGEGALDARVRVRDRSPVGELEQRFNEMAGRVEELLATQQSLVQAVAHEIRTPIARIQFQLEMMEMAKDEAEHARRAGELRAELDELDEMVGELLVFTRYDRGAADLPTEPVDVADAVAQQVRRAAERYPEIEVELDGVTDELRIEAHARSFHRVLKNLVENGLRYAEESLVIRALPEAAGGLELHVQDDGPGVPEPDRERIFEPFARVDDSRDRDTGGVGLGLAIVHRILAAHGGEVVVEEADGGGARFVTRWPGRPA